MVWPLTRLSFFMMSAILREKMSEPPPAEEVQIQVMFLLGTKAAVSVEALLPEVAGCSVFLPPQAARDRAMSSARVRAISFFMIFFSFFSNIFPFLLEN